MPKAGREEEVATALSSSHSPISIQGLPLGKLGWKPMGKKTREKVFRRGSSRELSRRRQGMVRTANRSKMNPVTHWQRGGRKQAGSRGNDRQGLWCPGSVVTTPVSEEAVKEVHTLEEDADEPC